MGDSRVYGMIIILRAVNSIDFMSAEPFEFPFQLLKNICRRIVNEVEGITRVLYDCTSKPPGKTCLFIFSPWFFSLTPNRNH
jgi:GMP synthase (glutamine-hydrolysing)